MPRPAEPLWFPCRDRRRSYVGADHLTRRADKIGCQESNVTRSAADIQYAHARRHACSLKPLARRRSEYLSLPRESLKFEIGMTEQVGRVFHGYPHPLGERATSARGPSD